jgi:hypothetical protein
VGKRVANQQLKILLPILQEFNSVADGLANVAVFRGQNGEHLSAFLCPSYRLLALYDFCLGQGGLSRAAAPVVVDLESGVSASHKGARECPASDFVVINGFSEQTSVSADARYMC